MELELFPDDEVKEAADNIEELASAAKTGVFKDDEDYLESYFGICEVLMKKKATLDQLRGDNRRPAAKEVAKEAAYLKERVVKLNAALKHMDKCFWARAEESVKDGRHFVVEELASHYSLDAFEKRIVLFFLYMEVVQASQNVYTDSELLNLLDFNNSPGWKLKAVSHFSFENKLRKNRIIMVERNFMRNQERREFCLSPRALNLISKMMKGEKVSWDEADKPFAPSCDEVGYIKDPDFALSDVILPEADKEKVLFLLEAYRDNKLESLGAFTKIKKGKGVVFLFYGPPGTGKSMLAEAIASHIGKKVLFVEYPKIMNSHLGETDKAISAIFRSAKGSDAVLCLDEADSLFYDRSSFAYQEHDIRFVNEMLQELERFEGVAVLTTNMNSLLDPALERRVSLKVAFELPDEAMRSKIWRSHIPDATKLASGVDFDALAKKYEFAGGYIKNAVLNALRKVALRKEDTITMDDLVFAADLENKGMYRVETARTVKGFKIA